MATDDAETHNLDAEKGGGYDYDQSEAQLQAFSDKAVSTRKAICVSKGTQRQTVTMIRNEEFNIIYFNNITRRKSFEGFSQTTSKEIFLLSFINTC